MDATQIPLPNGRAAAALLAAAVGCFSLGVFATLGDGSPAAARFFAFYAPTGPLSGVTTAAIVVWLVVWAALARAWRERDVTMARVGLLLFALMGLGLLFTFPPFVDLLLGKG
ncbi:MAG TPA: hypothetical protein VHB21_15710 [Minicystis sp.]|nr:hypothetical protein [Minicystis sp.]